MEDCRISTKKKKENDVKDAVTSRFMCKKSKTAFFCGRQFTKNQFFFKFFSFTPFQFCFFEDNV